MIKLFICLLFLIPFSKSEQRIIMPPVIADFEKPSSVPVPGKAPESGVQPDLSAPQLMDIFGIPENPGSGSLTYRYEEAKSEKIELGKSTGIYGRGMIFNSSVLPEPFKKDFQKSQILQIALGNMNTKDTETVPQFAAVTLLSDKIPSTKTLYRLAVPNSSELKKGPVAIMLFTSPALKGGSTDEEKLKETMFADGGNLILTPLKQKTVVVIKNKGEKYQFFTQTMKLNWAAELATPFATVKRTVAGTTEFPFFWPKDREAQKLTNRIASESFKSLVPGNGSMGTKTKAP